MSAASVGCLDGEQAIRDALAAGPTPGPWRVFNHSWSDTSILAVDFDHAVCLLDINYATEESQEADEAVMAANARLIAACNPETMRALLAELDTLRASLSTSKQAGAEPVMTCRHSNRSDCALFGMEDAAQTKTARPSREWYAAKIQETLDDDFAIGSVAPQTDAELQALEREHMGDPDKKTGIYSPNHRIGWWLSAALEDPNTCEEMKSDIRDWFASIGTIATSAVADARLQWLHSPASGNVDGWEWGIFKVKWGSREGEHQIRHTFADFSDLDEAMAASGAVLASREEAPATPAAATPAAPGEADAAKKLWETIKILGLSNEKLALQAITAALSHLAPVAAPASVPQAIEQLVSALTGSKGWLRDYARGVIEDAIDRRHLDVAAPAPASEAVAWSGWACQYPGKLPRLYGAKEIAEVNCDRENGDCMLLLATHPPIKQEQPACINGTLNTSQQLLDAAWLGATQKPADGSPERVGQDSHTQEGGSPELSDAVAAQRKWVDGHNERVTTHMSASGFVHPPLPVHHDSAAGQNLFTAEEMYEYAEDAFAHQAKFATPTPGDSADAPVQQAGEITDAMVDAYLSAQRRTVEEADKFGRPNVGGLHTNTVREACRNGLRAALKGEQPAQPSGSERGEV